MTSMRTMLQKTILSILFFTPISANNQIMSYDDYAKIRHTTPYTFELSKEHQALFYFGANHSCEPANEQYPLLKSFWQKFLQQTGGKNCVVLVEGSKRNLCQSEELAIATQGGEGGLMTLLAHQNNIPTECPEPSRQFLCDELLKYFSNDEVTYRNFALCVHQFHRYKHVDPHLKFEDHCQRYNDYKDLDHMKKIHKNLFNAELDVHDEKFFYNIINPVVQTTIINKVCRQASATRDEFIVNYIKNLMQQGKNVFVVYGCTHAVMQEAAIKDLWEK